MGLELITKKVVQSSWHLLEHYRMCNYKLVVNNKSGHVYWTWEPEDADITHLAEPRDFQSKFDQSWFSSNPSNYENAKAQYTCTVRWNPR